MLSSAEGATPPDLDGDVSLSESHADGIDAYSMDTSPRDESEDRALLGISHTMAAHDLRSHARVAHLVAAEAIDELLHVAGIGWFAWVGTHWERDKDDKRAKATVMAKIRELAPRALNDSFLLADLKQSQTASGIRGVLELMGALEGLRATTDDLDSDAYLLNVSNGTINLRPLMSSNAPVKSLDDLQLQRHDPRDRITRISRGRFRADASSDVWESFLALSLPDESVRDYLQRTMGLALIGEQLEHRLPICAGDGRNGKGVYYGAVGHALGSYSHNAPRSLFELTKGDPNRASPAMLDLRGVRVAWISETDKAARFDAALLKSLTGGDAITGRYLYESHSITFLPSHLAVLITNHPPQLPADDPAVWKRTRVIPWTVVIPDDQEDPFLPAKLKQQDEADAILTWMLVGLIKYRAGGLGEPAAVDDATSAYQGVQDTVLGFIDGRCSTAVDGGGSGPTDLHNAYREWCVAEGVMREHRLGLREFGARLDSLGHPTVKGTGGRRYRENLSLEDGRGAILIPTAHLGAASGDQQVAEQPGQKARHALVIAPTLEQPVADGHQVGESWHPWRATPAVPAYEDPSV